MFASGITTHRISGGAPGMCAAAALVPNCKRRGIRQHALLRSQHLAVVNRTSVGYGVGTIRVVHLRPNGDAKVSVQRRSLYLAAASLFFALLLERRRRHSKGSGDQRHDLHIERVPG
jgi:hypothetical protein